jgi:hypothetical protein
VEAANDTRQRPLYAPDRSPPLANPLIPLTGASGSRRPMNLVETLEIRHGEL